MLAERKRDLDYMERRSKDAERKRQRDTFSASADRSRSLWQYSVKILFSREEIMK
jgi:hypothetical protein